MNQLYESYRWAPREKHERHQRGIFEAFLLACDMDVVENLADR